MYAKSVQLSLLIYTLKCAGCHTSVHPYREYSVSFVSPGLQLIDGHSCASSCERSDLWETVKLHDQAWLGSQLFDRHK